MSAVAAPGVAPPLGFIFTTHGWIVIGHGIVLGGLFIAALAATLAALLLYRPALLTEAGRLRLAFGLKAAGLTAVVAGWATVLLGTFVVDPYFHGGNDPPAHILESYGGTVRWVTWAMPAKENLAWMSVIFATVAVVAVFVLGDRLLARSPTRTLVLAFLGLAFAFAGVAGLLGAGLAKVGPIV
ncbi:MAG TPA: hypothetical protein VK576_09730 [Thermoleophilia bacterium]|nr:hypothetical protein [Thermoleophilia bacterium]